MKKSKKSETKTKNQNKAENLSADEKSEKGVKNQLSLDVYCIGCAWYVTYIQKMMNMAKGVDIQLRIEHLYHG